MHVILMQIPIDVDRKQEFDQLINSEQGLAFTQQKPGFISAESGYTTDDEGNLVWNCWEKWETREHFHTYHAQRLEDTEFINKWFSITEGNRPLWIEELSTTTNSKHDK